MSKYNITFLCFISSVRDLCNIPMYSSIDSVFIHAFGWRRHTNVGGRLDLMRANSSSDTRDAFTNNNCGINGWTCSSLHTVIACVIVARLSPSEMFRVNGNCFFCRFLDCIEKCPLPGCRLREIFVSSILIHNGSSLPAHCLCKKLLHVHRASASGALQKHSRLIFEKKNVGRFLIVNLSCLHGAGPILVARIWPLLWVTALDCFPIDQPGLLSWRSSLAILLSCSHMLERWQSTKTTFPATSPTA